MAPERGGGDNLGQERPESGEIVNEAAETSPSSTRVEPARFSLDSREDNGPYADMQTCVHVTELACPPSR
jgi:hypothetical protein